MNHELENWDIGQMVGRTIMAVTNGTGAPLDVEAIRDGEAVVLVLDDGTHVTMNHEQECCESVWLEDVVGDLADIIGSPLTMAEESTSFERPEDAAGPLYQPESQTWTFYKFAAAKGYVTLRWCGTSNGYYSEQVTMSCSRPDEDQ